MTFKNQIANIDLALTKEERFELISRLTGERVDCTPGFRVFKSVVERVNLSLLIRVIFQDKGFLGGGVTEPTSEARKMRVELLDSLVAAGYTSIGEISPWYQVVTSFALFGNGPLGYLDRTVDYDTMVTPDPTLSLVYTKKTEALLKGLAKCGNFVGVRMPTVFLFGPPGTGKSSFLRGLCDLNDNLTSTQLPITDFIKELNKDKKQDWDYDVIVIDELDKASKLVEENLAKILSYLDNKPQSQIIILTANTGPDKFPQALLRPGRVDIIEEITFMTEDLAKKLFQTLVPTIQDKAFKAYKEANNNPESFQPSAIAAFVDHIKRQCVIDMIVFEEEFPEEEIKKISFLKNAKWRKKQRTRRAPKPMKGRSTVLSELLRKVTSS